MRWEELGRGRYPWKALVDALDDMTFRLAKGLCRAKFWAKFAFWKGAVWGGVFGEVCGEAFGGVFGLVLLGHSEQEIFSTHFSPKVPWLCTAKLVKIQRSTS